MMTELQGLLGHTRPQSDHVGHTFGWAQGRVLDEILARRAVRPRVAYVGDGGGDFCPACELGIFDGGCVVDMGMDQY